MKSTVTNIAYPSQFHRNFNTLFILLPRNCNTHFQLKSQTLKTALTKLYKNQSVAVNAYKAKQLHFYFLIKAQVSGQWLRASQRRTTLTTRLRKKGRCLGTKVGVITWLVGSPVEDEPFGKHDTLEVVVVVGRNAEVVQMVAGVAVGDLRETKSDLESDIKRADARRSIPRQTWCACCCPRDGAPFSWGP